MEKEGIEGTDDEGEYDEEEEEYDDNQVAGLGT